MGPCGPGLPRFPYDRKCYDKIQYCAARPHNQTKPENTVESLYNGPASNGNLPITEANFFFIFYIGNKRNPPITDGNGWSLEIR